MTQDDWPTFIAVHLAYVYVACARISGHDVTRVDLDDMVQLAFERALKADAGGRDEAGRRGLLGMCAQRAVQDFWRAKAGRRRFGLRAVDLEYDPELDTSSIDPRAELVDAIDLERALGELPARDAAALRQSAAGYSCREIGEQLGVTESRVSQLHTRGRARLAELLAA